MTPDLSAVVTAERTEQSRRPERMTPLAYAAEERFEPDDWDQP